MKARRRKPPGFLCLLHWVLEYTPVSVETIYYEVHLHGDQNEHCDIQKQFIPPQICDLCGVGRLQVGDMHLIYLADLLDYRHGVLGFILICFHLFNLVGVLFSEHLYDSLGNVRRRYDLAI